MPSYLDRVAKALKNSRSKRLVENPVAEYTAHITPQDCNPDAWYRRSVSIRALSPEDAQRKADILERRNNYDNSWDGYTGDVLVSLDDRIPYGPRLPVSYEEAEELRRKYAVPKLYESDEGRGLDYLTGAEIKRFGIEGKQPNLEFTGGRVDDLWRDEPYLNWRYNYHWDKNAGFGEDVIR